MGDCRVCGLEYKIKREVRSSAGQGGYRTIPCPECKYDPSIEYFILQIIKGIKVELSANGGIKVNSLDIKDRILEEIVRYWPKKKDNSSL